MCTPVTLRPLSAVVLVIHAAGVGCPLPAVGTRGRLTVGAQDSQLSIPTPLALPVTVRVRFGRVCEVGGWFVFMAGWPCLSWQGMEYLAALERLSVYRIRISSPAEVFRLHCLTELAEVHFRLHPVVESESDYRLFVVRLLPRLRQLRRPAALWASLGAARWVSRVLGVTALLTLLEREADFLLSQESCLEGGREPLPCGHRWLLGHGHRRGLALLSSCSWCPVSWPGLLGIVSGSAGHLGST